MIQVTDWIYNPKTDKIGLSWYVPELLLIVYLEIERHQDLAKIIPKLKQDILSGKALN